ncbi:MAG: hypothetical protein ACREEM_23830 [Blastocatellia bacterium]
MTALARQFGTMTPERGRAAATGTFPDGATDRQPTSVIPPIEALLGQ